MRMFKNFFLAQFFLLLLLKSVSAAKVEEINVSGNERISKDTIIIFGEIDLKDDFNKNKINEILKNLFSKELGGKQQYGTEGEKGTGLGLQLTKDFIVKN